MRTQGSQVPTPGNTAGHPPCTRGAAWAITWGSGEAGDPWVGAGAVGRPQRWGRRLHVTPGLFLACKPGMARPSSSPGTQRCSPVATPRSCTEPCRAPPPLVTAQPVSDLSGRPAHGWLLIAVTQTPTFWGLWRLRRVPRAVEAVSLTPLTPFIRTLPTGAGVQVVPDPCQPCPAGHGASVPGGRGRSRQDPEALHPEGPRPLSLSFPPHSRKNSRTNAPRIRELKRG